MRYPSMRFLAQKHPHLQTITGVLATAVLSSAIFEPAALAETKTTTTASSQFSYTAFEKSGAKIGVYPTLSKAARALDAYPGGFVRDKSGQIKYTQPDFTNVDLRFPAPSNVNGASIHRFLLQHGSPLADLASTFIDAERVYGVNANYLVAHAIEESGWGRSSFAIENNNLYGTGVYDGHANLAAIFPSLDYAIRYQAWVVRKNYLNGGFSHYVSPTLDGMSKNYASDPAWANNIRKAMNQLAVYLGDTVKSYTQYRAGTPDPKPVVNAEPGYFVNGAIATGTKDSFYGDIPVYPSVGEGQLGMFSRTLQLGSRGDDVSGLQTALNDIDNAGLTVDGNFGPTTQTAIAKLQTERGMTATGTCDFALWSQIQSTTAPQTLPSNGHFAIDEIMQGMLGADVTLWFHVRKAGWVNARDMRLQNVYRIVAPNPNSPTKSSVALYDASKPTREIAKLHAGDWVVCGNPKGAHRQIVIHDADQRSGRARVGVLKTTQAHLTAVQ